MVDDAGPDMKEAAKESKRISIEQLFDLDSPGCFHGEKSYWSEEGPGKWRLSSHPFGVK